MPVLQAAWMFYLHHSALVINALGLFYALSGSWLLIATQIRVSRSISQLATSPTATEEEPAPASQRINRLFNRVGAICLGAGLLLSLISTQL
ncbi:hypothetical protein [Halopseudomonas pelagia]|uniref:hypothetical protein n=1 Tax=Halopseudomonas pelagia TaxID=553151 RepID=UPI0003A95B67|nr:hypothetical protein [Halopseudomonas pelagia]|tara:strand:+ start:444 stop:719 length:276 start_codon:yes stop_codon:yes gene_type:complete